MVTMRRFGLVDVLLLLLVLGVAAGTRVGYLFALANGAREAGPLQVQESSPEGETKTLISNVRENLWFGVKAPFAPGDEVTAHTAPGYPYLVGLLAREVPENQLESTVRWIQAGLGTLTAGLYFLFARRAFRSLSVGLVAGLFTALYPFWIVNVAALEDGTLASFALAGSLFLASQAGEKGGAVKSLFFGGALAGLSLVRATMLPFSFILLAWFLIRSRSLKAGWLCGLLAVAGFAGALAPWTVRNFQVFNEPLPVVSSTYLNLWVGNNPLATGGPATPAMFEAGPLTDLEQLPEQPARYARLGKTVVEEVTTNPVGTMRRRIVAFACFLLGERWLADGTLAEKTNPTAELPEWLGTTYPLIFQLVLLALLVLAFLGWRWSYGWRWESIPAVLALLWVPLPYILGHGEALSGPRLPLDGVLLCYAAFTFCCLLPGGGWLLDAPGAGEA